MTERRARHMSAGGVIVRRRDGHVEVCLIGRRRQDAETLWGLPKGHPEAGESPQEAAVREVREETGLQGRPVTPLGWIVYEFSGPQDRTRYAKTVHFYLLEYLEGEVRPQAAEVDDARWVSLDEAIAHISYENERHVLLRAKRYLEAVGDRPGTQAP